MSDYEAVWHGGNKRYILTYPGIQGEPLVVVLHPRYTQAKAMAALIGPGKLLPWTIIMPQGLPNARPEWNDSPYSTSEPDDVSFIKYAIARAVKQYRSSHVFLIGFSNGAFMVTRCLHGGVKVRGAAQVAGTVLEAYTRSPWVAQPTPMMLIHGTDDPVVPYDGEPGLMSVPRSRDYWLSKLGTWTSRTFTLPDVAVDGITTSVDATTTTNGPVTLYTVNNGGHTWPGSTKNLTTTGRTSMDFDATIQIREFFKRLM